MNGIRFFIQLFEDVLTECQEQIPSSEDPVPSTRTCTLYVYPVVQDDDSKTHEDINIEKSLLSTKFCT